MNRRSFFKFLPIAPVALAAEGARAATADQSPNDCSVRMTLHASKAKNENLMHLPSSIYSYQETDMTRSVSVSVGNDGRLWLKSKDDVWKRVVTE